MACGGMSAPLSGYQRSSSKAFVPLGYAGFSILAGPDRFHSMQKVPRQCCGRRASRLPMLIGRIRSLIPNS